MQRLIDSALTERLRPFLCCSSSNCDKFVSRLNIGKLDVFVIRDDLNSTAYPGNKFWKFHYFRQLLAEDQRSARRYKQVVAFGGNQSNAMLASAHLASEFNLKFKYYTRALSQMARKNIKERKGNISEALALGAQIVEVPDGDSNQYESRWENVPEIKHELGCEENLVIPRGGACPMAEYGLKQLALKIWRFHSCRHVGLSGIVVVPAGTGTTAFFLQKHFNWLSNDTKLKIVCVPVVRNEKFLLEQMRLLDSTGPFPQIISTSQRYKFAVPHPHLKAVWCMLKRKGLLFDLIYAPVAWKALLEHADLFRDEIIYYLHTALFNSASLHNLDLLHFEIVFGKAPQVSFCFVRLVETVVRPGYIEDAFRSISTHLGHEASLVSSSVKRVVARVFEGCFTPITMMNMLPATITQVPPMLIDPSQVVGIKKKGIQDSAENVSTVKKEFGEKLDCKHKCKDKAICGHECCKRLFNFFSRAKRRREENGGQMLLASRLDNQLSDKYTIYLPPQQQDFLMLSEIEQDHINNFSYSFLDQDSFSSMGNIYAEGDWESKKSAKKRIENCEDTAYSKGDNALRDGFRTVLGSSLTDESHLQLPKIFISVAHEDDSSYDCAIEVLLFQSPEYYNETVGDVKRRMLAQVEDYEYANLLNIFASEWWLGNVPLADGTMLRNLNLRSYASIVCKPWPKSYAESMDLIVSIPNMGSIGVSISSDQRVGHIKVLVCSQHLEISERDLELRHKCLILDDTALIDSCNLTSGDVLEGLIKDEPVRTMGAYVKSIKRSTNAQSQILRVELDKLHELVNGSCVDVNNVFKVVNSATGEVVQGSLELSNNMVVTFHPSERMKSARYRVVMQPKAFSNYRPDMAFSRSELAFPFQVQGKEHTMLYVARKGQMATDCNVCLSRTSVDLYEELKLTIAATFGFNAEDISQLRSGANAKCIVEEHDDVKRLKNKERVWFVLTREGEIRWAINENAYMGSGDSKGIF